MGTRRSLHTSADTPTALDHSLASTVLRSGPLTQPSPLLLLPSHCPSLGSPGPRFQPTLNHSSALIPALPPWCPVSNTIVLMEKPSRPSLFCQLAVVPAPLQQHPKVTGAGAAVMAGLGQAWLTHFIRTHPPCFLIPSATFMLCCQTFPNQP